MWSDYKKSKSIWERLFGGPVILKDEEHISGARVTLEQKRGSIPFEITCGVYGTFFHTVFSSSQSEAEEKYDKIKSEISRLFEIEQSDEEFYEWIEQFTSKY